MNDILKYSIFVLISFSITFGITMIAFAESEPIQCNWTAPHTAITCYLGMIISNQLTQMELTNNLIEQLTWNNCVEKYKISMSYSPPVQHNDGFKYYLNLIKYCGEMPEYNRQEQEINK